MLTHGNFVSNVVAGCEVIPFTADATALSFLPLSHVFERMLDYAYLYKGATIAYAESIDSFAANFIEVKPTASARCRASTRRSTPGSWRRSRRAARSRGRSSPGRPVGRKRPCRTRTRRAPADGARAAKPPIADTLVFSKIRGGARHALPLRGLRAARRSRASSPSSSWAPACQIYEGYGLTETSPVICVNGPGRWRLGTVGQPLRGVEVQIAADGEILTRGPHVMKGYFNKPEATAEAIDAEGWFHTGDIGELDGRVPLDHRPQEGPHRPRRRKEGRAAADRERAQAVALHRLPIVIGDRQKFLSALIVPNFDALKEWARRAGIDAPGMRSTPTPTCARLFQQEIDAYNAGQAPPRADPRLRPAAGHLTLEDGSITPTLKVKRRIVESRYHDLIERMYEAAGKSMSRDVVVIDGLRTPYSRAGTELKDVAAADLGRIAIVELFARTGFDPAELDEVIFGNIAQPPDAANVARVAALRAGVPQAVPAFTVNRLCGSGLQSIVDARTGSRPATTRPSSPAASSRCRTSRSSSRGRARRCSRGLLREGSGTRLAAASRFRPAAFQAGGRAPDGADRPRLRPEHGADGRSARQGARHHAGGAGRVRAALAPARHAARAKLAEEIVPVPIPPGFAAWRCTTTACGRTRPWRRSGSSSPTSTASSAP